MHNMHKEIDHQYILFLYIYVILKVWFLKNTKKKKKGKKLGDPQVNVKYCKLCVFTIERKKFSNYKVLSFIYL